MLVHQRVTDIRRACPAPIESTINQFIKPMKIMKVARDDINPKHQYHYITYHDFGYSFLSYFINIINVCKAMGNHPQNYQVYANGSFTVLQKWARVGGGVGWGGAATFMYMFIHYSLHITATSLVLPYTLAHYVTGAGLGMRWGITFMYVYITHLTKSQCFLHRLTRLHAMSQIRDGKWGWGG